MNPSTPDPDQWPHPVEQRLRQCRPRRVALTADAILAASKRRELAVYDHDDASQMVASPSLRPEASAYGSHKTAFSSARTWAVGLSAFAAGVLLTYVVMRRPVEHIDRPPVANVTRPMAVPAAPDGDSTQRHVLVSPDITVSEPSFQATDPWRAWQGPDDPLDESVILAVRGSRPRAKSAVVRPRDTTAKPLSVSQTVWKPQPILHRGMLTSKASESGPLLKELLNPL